MTLHISPDRLAKYRAHFAPNQFSDEVRDALIHEMLNAMNLILDTIKQVKQSDEASLWISADDDSKNLSNALESKGIQSLPFNHAARGEAAESEAP